MSSSTYRSRRLARLEHEASQVLRHSSCHRKIRVGLSNRPSLSSDYRAMTFTLNINGTPVRADVDADTPLLWVLRDSLDLVGTKFGCGGGFCGACTVHVDGRARRACQTAVKEIGAARVTTIEGLSATGTHPVQRAWEEMDVPQCGYCQTGQIMSAAALLSRTPHPTDEEIASALSGNLCRCGTYMRIRQAVRRAATLASTPSPGGER